MLDYFALAILFFVALTLFYGIIIIHDIPYEISVKRNHPHQDAIHVAGWVSLFTLHAIWPFLWIWATLYREDRAWGFASSSPKQEQEQEADNPLAAQLDELTQRIDLLEQQINTTETNKQPAESVAKEAE